MGDGTLDPDGADCLLSHAVLGGRHLHDEYYVVYVSAAETRDVAAALLAVDPGWLRRRFDAINDPDCAGAQDDTDFEYTWTNFVDVRAFYQRAAAARRAVIFTACRSSSGARICRSPCARGRLRPRCGTGSADGRRCRTSRDNCQRPFGHPRWRRQISPVAVTDSSPLAAR
ncbi:DUF1877 family protein [Actinoplanes sp. NPDC051633]|uniref:DUF1877 family protein n=1 Tax=Actinoplanes sp. NPDC051633 TaxID=3155670 RepID=UPI0034331581